MQTFNMKIRGKREEARDVVTLVFDKPDGLAFLPGQYGVFSMIGVEGLKDETRPFTFASSPLSKDLEVTVKRMGKFTNAFCDLEVGRRVEVSGPQGKKLVYDESVEGDPVFIAGGSGITPFISAIRYHKDKGMDSKLTLLYFNKTKKDIIFEDELSELSKSGSLTVINSITDDAPDGWVGETGRISREMIKKHVMDIEGKIWYVCGPIGMTDASEDILKEMGILGEHVRIEKWKIPGKSDVERS